jgi:phosphopantothenoylcysteine decarboxylase/phosphopantothenate--cysteine ligase
MLDGRRIVVCVTGGVAAYKSAYVTRRLVESGASVKVAMSETAPEFIGAQTFAAITGEQPLTSLFGNESVSPHTELARWANLVIVAPATAATIGRLANGISEGLVSAICLATRAPILVAPAMHTEMWEHPATQRNMEQLIADGVNIIGPNSGDLAGGDSGIGRVAEPEEIVEAADRILGAADNGLAVLVTAGGTREPIDPVRFVGNRSSGRMGHAIADEAAARGYRVTLVTTSDIPVHPGVKVVSVETAEEMQDAVAAIDADIAVMAAAVADFRPADPKPGKLARADGLDSIALEPTPDILASVVSRDDRPFVVGFAAETGGIERAIEKAAAKNVDLLVYNDVTEPGSGFGTSTNRVVIIARGGAKQELPLMAKTQVAAALWDRISADVARQN